MSRAPALGIGPALQVEVTAAVVLGVRLLALPGPALERELHAAAERNPALVIREVPCCGRCGRRCAGGTCAQCRAAVTGPRDIALRAPGEPGHGATSRWPRALNGTGPAPEPGDAPSVTSAWEQLRQDLLAALPTRLAGAAMTVLATLDERGLLRPEEAAGLPTEVRDTVLAALREVGPPGIGAATVAESLLLQLDTAPLNSADRALARLLLRQHAAALAAGGPAAVARAVGCPPERIEALVSRLARVLRPFPGLALPGSAAGGGPRLRPPDLVFERDGDTVRALVPECERWVVEVDPAYRQALATARPGARPNELAAVRAQLRDAATLADQVQRRWALMTRLGALLAGVHGARLLAGSTAFPPLTQAAAASRLGVHESTISRAVRHRTARLVDGTVVPLRRLFGAHHDARAAVAELLGRDPRPSDAAIAAALAEQGLRIARRTVTKYRHALSR